MFYFCFKFSCIVYKLLSFVNSFLKLILNMYRKFALELCVTYKRLRFEIAADLCNPCEARSLEYFAFLYIFYLNCFLLL